MKKTIRKDIAIPEGVELKADLPMITVKGPLGEVSRKFNFDKIKVAQNGMISLECANATKKEKKVMNSIAAHIANMIRGVMTGFEYKLQVCSIHFPITVKHEKGQNALVIKNFLGERKDREVKLVSGVDVSIEGDVIKLKGVDVERVAQCAASIETATKIKARDRRIYQDGIFIIAKAGEGI